MTNEKRDAIIEEFWGTVCMCENTEQAYEKAKASIQAMTTLLVRMEKGVYMHFDDWVDLIPIGGIYEENGILLPVTFDEFKQVIAYMRTRGHYLGGHR